MLSLAVAIALSGLPAIAQTDRPNFYDGRWPDGQGNYPIREEYVGQWEVVDPDPNGLNCRGNILPYEGSEEVVRKLYQGDRIQAVQRGRGIYELVEQDGKTWLRVQVSGGGECWVRANEIFVKPVKARRR